jgi:hypothetical protein
MRDREEGFGFPTGLHASPMLDEGMRTRMSRWINPESKKRLLLRISFQRNYQDNHHG